MHLTSPSQPKPRAAIIASARAALWMLVVMLLRLCDRSVRRRRALRHLTRFAEHALASIIILMAASRATATPQTATKRPRATPTGFRRSARRESARHAWMRAIRLRTRGTVRQRLERILAVLDDPSRFVTRLVRRFEIGRRPAGLVVVAPTAFAMRTRALFGAPLCADSS